MFRARLKGETMKPYERYLLALLIVVVDLLVFAIPLTAIVLAYILIARPPAFKEWVSKVYS